MKKLSLFGQLNVKDFLQGVIYAVIMAAITYLIEIMRPGDFSLFDFKAFGTVILNAAIAYGVYIFKRFFSNSDGTFAKKEGDPYRR